MLCKSFDKEVPCKEEATLEVFWPGKTTQACVRHEQKMQSIAVFMGFSLASRPLVEPELNPEGSKS